MITVVGADAANPAADYGSSRRNGDDQVVSEEIDQVFLVSTETSDCFEFLIVRAIDLSSSFLWF